MLLLYLAGALTTIALLLPSTPGLPLTLRYRLQAGSAAPPPSRHPLRTRLPTHRLLPLLPQRYTKNLQTHLLQANLATAWPLPTYLAVKLLVSTILVLLMLLYWSRIDSPWFGLTLPVQAVAGWALPDFFVKRRAAGRRQAVQRALPHLLANLAICLQTGLSLRSSLIHLAELYPAGVLGQELRAITAHLHAGATPREALAALTERVGTPELTQALGGIVAQADKSLGAAAQAAAAASRLAWQQRRRQAEAIAHSASLKLYFPQLLLGMPALFLVLLGPAALAMWQAMRNL